MKSLTPKTKETLLSHLLKNAAKSIIEKEQQKVDNPCFVCIERYLKTFS